MPFIYPGQEWQLDCHSFENGNLSTTLGTYLSEMKKDAFQDHLELVYQPQESCMLGRPASVGPLASPVLVTDITNRS